MIYVSLRYYYDDWNILGVYTSVEAAQARNEADRREHQPIRDDGFPCYAYEIEAFALDEIE